VAAKKGLFEVADGGTLFLDEVASMPSSLQVKLLRALQEGAFFPVGGTQEIKVDVRVIAASNQDLSQAVAQGAFREDLYYRLNVIPVHIPPLRERREDILLLATHFLEKYKASLPKALEGFSKEAAELLLCYDWPGNVRELENAVEHGVTLAKGPFVEVADLPDIRQVVLSQASSWIAGFIAQPLRVARQMFEREYFRELLKISQGNVSETARMARIARQNLQAKLKILDLNPRDVPRRPKSPPPQV
jgi:DNA-binding NtrC family response regulator